MGDRRGRGRRRGRDRERAESAYLPRGQVSSKAWRGEKEERNDDTPLETPRTSSSVHPRRRSSAMRLGYLETSYSRSRKSVRGGRKGQKEEKRTSKPSGVASIPS
jgi:hypothetical protein